MQDVPKPNTVGVSMPCQIGTSLLAQNDIEECDHKGHYRLSGGAYCAIRYCVQCGKSWRAWIKPEYNNVPLAEWEEIKEHMEVPPLPATFYDDAVVFEDDEDDLGDEE